MSRLSKSGFSSTSLKREGDKWTHWTGYSEGMLTLPISKPQNPRSALLCQTKGLSSPKRLKPSTPSSQGRCSTDDLGGPISARGSALAFWTGAEEPPTPTGAPGTGWIQLLELRLEQGEGDVYGLFEPSLPPFYHRKGRVIQHHQVGEEGSGGAEPGTPHSSPETCLNMG